MNELMGFGDSISVGIVRAPHTFNWDFYFFLSMIVLLGIVSFFAIRKFRNRNGRTGIITNPADNGGTT